MDFLKLEKPELKAVDRLKVIRAFEDPQKNDELSNFIKRANEPEYSYWDTLQHKRPLPAGLSATQAWYAVKLTRRIERQKSEILSEDGHRFSWSKLSVFDRYCHELDMHTGGELLTSVGDLKADEKKRLISKGLMDEAIASAQLEGADTGREYAQKMLREKIKPRNDSDQMILNNHNAMLAVEADHKSRPLSMDLLLEMHSILTEKTLDDDGNPPALRKDDRPLYVLDDVVGVIYHKAPPVEFMRNELSRMIEFANTEEKEFMHPVIKAAMLHFWMGYLHPFTDGNGRLARLLFYWYVLRHDYWAFGFLPIATKIKKNGKKSYTMAYVYSEQDEYDLTYFINYLLRKSIETHKEFQEYVSKKRKTNVGLAQVARAKHELNDRQIQLLKFLLAKKDNSTTIESYKSVNRVSRATTISDLTELTNKGLTRKQKIGRTVYFYGTDLLEQLLEEADS